MSIDYNQCVYLNAEKDNSVSMLKKCINGPTNLIWPCVEKEAIDNDIFSLVTERPQADNITDNLDHSLVGVQPKKQNLVNIDTNMFENSNVEGFTNMGEKYVRPDDVPDGYFRCPKTGEVKQVCMNCKYNQRTYGKSKEFNEADPCFPNQGVYDGIDNQGNTMCTCGSRGQYCGDNFTAQGGFFTDDMFIMNVGDFGHLGTLASY